MSVNAAMSRGLLFLLPPSTAFAAGFAPDLLLLVTNDGNTMVHRASFTLAIQYEGSTQVTSSELTCVTTPGDIFFNPSTLSTVSTDASVLDLTPQQSYNCTSGATSWPTLKYLPPGSVTLKPVGQIGDSQGTVNAPYVFVTIPSSPHMVLTVDASKCQQNVQAGKNLLSQ